MAADEDELCALCMGEMPERDPRMLPCTHSFCFPCLQAFPQIDFCFVCRRAFKPALASVGELPRNIWIKRSTEMKVRHHIEMQRLGAEVTRLNAQVAQLRELQAPDGDSGIATANILQHGTLVALAAQLGVATCCEERWCPSTDYSAVIHAVDSLRLRHNPSPAAAAAAAAAAPPPMPAPHMRPFSAPVRSLLDAAAAGPRPALAAAEAAGAEIEFQFDSKMWEELHESINLDADDDDDDGGIEAVAFREFFDQLGSKRHDDRMAAARTLFSQLDKNSSGALTENQFVRMLLLGRGIDAINAQSLFSIFAPDGELRVDQFCEAVVCNL